MGDTTANDLIDGLAAAAAMASEMNIEIKNVRPVDKEYTWLGVIHANQTATQFRVNQDTTIEMIEDILEAFSKHPYMSDTRCVLLYTAHGMKFDAELSMATFTADFTPEDAAGLLKSVYGENGVSIIDYTTYSSVYGDGGGIGVDADLVKRCIDEVTMKSRPRRTSVDIPAFMTRR